MKHPFFNFLQTHKTQLAQIMLVILFLGTLAWGASISTTSLDAPLEENASLEETALSAEAAGTPAAAESSPAAATTPVEFTPNQNETEGIIFAGIVLVLIIIVGTLGVIKQRF